MSFTVWVIGGTRVYADNNESLTAQKEAWNRSSIFSTRPTCTATTAYAYTLTWEMNGKPYNESGKDLFVLTFENQKWVAVWRKLISV